MGKVATIDYDKLINQFGICQISPEFLERFEKITGHPTTSRHVFSHQDSGSL